jgi:GxxExxY protein
MAQFRKTDLSPEIEAVASGVIGAAFEVHTILGPGLLESVYERALLHELGQRGFGVQTQVELIVPYKDIEIRGQRADLLVEGTVIIELKVVSELAPVHKAQLLSYLRAARVPLGLLINFNAAHLREGVKRVLNERALTTSSPSRPSRS